MQQSNRPAVREFPVADAKAGPYGITAGPDGALWLTLVHSGEIARRAVDGELSRYPAGPTACRPSIITAGPDGALWFTRSADHHIGRITTDGTLTAFALPEPASFSRSCPQPQSGSIGAGHDVCAERRGDRVSAPGGGAEHAAELVRETMPMR